MSLLANLFSRPKRPSDGSVCPSCGSPMIPDQRVIRPSQDVALTQYFFHCTNRWCGHNLLRGEPTTDHTEIVTPRAGESVGGPRAGEDH